MKANNLTICVDAQCKKNCPYCVSKMTWSPEPNHSLFCRNINKAKKMAELASVSSVLITSKGEPLQNLEMTSYCLNKFVLFPTEIQTNGHLLTEKLTEGLALDKLNTIAISIDRADDITSFAGFYEHCHKLGIIIRLTVVLTDLWDINPELFMKYVKIYGISQITFRMATIPNNCTSYKTAVWIREHTSQNQSKFLKYFKAYSKSKNLIRNLSFGASVYDCNGIAVTIMEYCIQESNNVEDIRSLIYHQDGHMYTSWNRASSILF